MPNKFDEKIFDSIVEELKSLYHIKGPSCTYRIEIDSNHTDDLRVWNSICQIAEIAQLVLDYHRFVGDESECPIDEHELTKLNGITQLQNLSIFDIPFTGSCFATVTNLIHLRKINISLSTTNKKKCFDKFFDWTQNFPELVAISLESTPLLKPNFKNLINNHKLRSISMEKCNLTDSSFKLLVGHPSLYSLWVDKNNITGESFSFISECPFLAELFLCNNKLTPKGIATIVKACKSKCVELDISGNIGVNDSCLKDIASMEELMNLTMIKTNITDKGIMYLSERQSLRYLDVRETKVSEKAAQELHKKIPYCHIIYGTFDENKEIVPEEDGYYEHFNCF
jgi:hypothetical protein